ncbi:hypothetical protein K443DRAFT_569760 [Laccaria amethystina LaAM-08-1]|jgi:hypothetical protein|uniref:Uncharacterized protein n=1 Tax=Laccaria amethystina LaAM-08-1 TaxID=1095629 RepID=A0A0C9XUC4_9AGAR|nr:hypothetical protein K443DRAFT_569760 [Laccaria amethystina LaAM-08-1]
MPFMIEIMDFGNLHTDFQSVSFLALVQVVRQRTQEIVQLNGERRIWSLTAFLRPRLSLNVVFSGLKGTALAEVGAPQRTKSRPEMWSGDLRALPRG